MFQLNRNFIFGFLFVLLIFIGLISCGKVTQQVNTEKDEPSFSLNFSVDQVFLPTNNIAEEKVLKQGFPKRQFNYTDPLFVSVKGYKDKQATYLAWGKCVITKKELPAKEKNNLSYSYSVQSFDSKDIEVKGLAKKTQLKANLSGVDLKVDVPKLDFGFDYYFVSVFSSNQQYFFTVLSNEDVSKNKIVTIDSLSDYDSFRALMFLDFKQSMNLDQKNYKKIQDILSRELFFAFESALPAYRNDSFNAKKPSFVFTNTVYDQLAKLIELAFVDIKESEALIEKDKMFTPKQKKLLIKQLRLALSEN
jgi:hypothetical protein